MAAMSMRLVGGIVAIVLLAGPVAIVGTCQADTGVVQLAGIFSTIIGVTPADLILNLTGALP